MKAVSKAQIPDAVAAMAEKTRAAWEGHRSVMRFVSRNFPEDWERIQVCRQSARYRRSTDDPTKYRILPNACRKIPYCIECTRADDHFRTFKALARLGLVTPTGRKVRAVHIVMTAPIYEDGTGWGRAASEDVPGFAAMVRDSLRDLYGTGIGGVMSYQDFGERSFAKRHPHMDLTLNGYLLEDGEVRRTPMMNLSPRGVRRVKEVTKRQAGRFGLDATESNVHFGRPIVGARVYYKTLRYQLRELVDLRKIQYRPSEHVVYWTSYRERKRTRFSEVDFLHGLEEYQHRLGRHGVNPGKKTELHRYYGYMAKRSLSAAHEAFGGVEVNEDELNDWEPYYSDDIERLLPRPVPLEV